MNGVSVIAEHRGGSHDRPRCSAKTGADADPNLLTSPASENKISHLHKLGSDRILDISLILCFVVIGTRETNFFPERPADVAMPPVQAVRVGHILSFRRSRGSPGYSTWGACRGSNSRAGHCTCGATPKSGSVRGGERVEGEREMRKEREGERASDRERWRERGGGGERWRERGRER